MERQRHASAERHASGRRGWRLGVAAAIFAMIAVADPSTAALAGTSPSSPIAGNSAVNAFGNNVNGQLWSAVPHRNPVPVAPSHYAALVRIITYNGHSRLVRNPCTPAAMKKAAMISAGGDFGMALIAGGAVCVWGDNYWGQEAQGNSVYPQALGGNPTHTDGAVPVCLPESWTLVGQPGYGYCDDAGLLVHGATSISAGGAFALVLFGNGSQVPGDATVTPSIPASALPHGSVAAWGANYDGQLGSNWSANSAGAPYTCANGNSNCARAPVAVVGGACGNTTNPFLDQVARISAGYNFALAVMPGAVAGAITAVVCAWGDNTDGQLGLGATSNQSPAGDSPNLCPYTGPSASSYCAWTPQPVTSICDGQMTAAGTPGPLRDVYDISAGVGLSLALLTDGSVCSWGDNGHGELGINSNSGPSSCSNNVLAQTTSCALSAQQVRAGSCPGSRSSDLGTAYQISAGNFDALALIGSVPWRGGTVCSWGNGAGGALGDHAVADRWVPGPVLGLRGRGHLATATCISAGDRHGLAVLGIRAAAGTLVSWGDEPVTTTGQNGFLGPSWWPVGVPTAAISSAPRVTRASSISAGSGEWNLFSQGVRGCILPPPPP